VIYSYICVCYSVCVTVCVLQCVCYSVCVTVCVLQCHIVLAHEICNTLLKIKHFTIDSLRVSSQMKNSGFVSETRRL
jgi:hypothetical protein